MNSEPYDLHKKFLVLLKFRAVLSFIQFIKIIIFVRLWAIFRAIYLFIDILSKLYIYLLISNFVFDLSFLI